MSTAKLIRWQPFILLAALVGLLVSLFTVAPVVPQPVAAGSSGPGTIAYVRADTWDDIRLVEPDGDNDRLLWTHGQSDPDEVYAIWSLAWRPDAGELAFASTHELGCSLHHSDIYAVAVNGGNYRRLTQAPDCASLANYPKGTVRVPVTNNSLFGEPVDIFLYFQGAPGVQQVSLPPGGSSIVTFHNVADFGDGWLQVAVAIKGHNRYIHFETAVDVKAGETVTTATAHVSEPFAPGFEPRSPTWRSDSSKVGFVFSFHELYGIEPQPQPLTFGEPLTEVGAQDQLNFINHLAYGPTPARANQLLHDGVEVFDSVGIYLTSEGSATLGEQLVTYDFFEAILGLAWLPDGSGFVYAVTEGDYFSEDRGANLFEYNFATGQKQRLTNFSGEFAGPLSIAPDGQQIVFERAATMAEFGYDLVDPDLWIVNRDGSGLRLLVENGRTPAWSPGDIQAPPPEHSFHLYLPMVLR
jgi:hypothetical protein